MPNSRDGSIITVNLVAVMVAGLNGRRYTPSAASFFSEHPLIIVGRQHANDIIYARQDGRRRHYKRFSITTNYEK